jgi:hypothetical protein
MTIQGNLSLRDGVHFEYITDSSIKDIDVKGFGRDGLHAEMGWIKRFRSNNIYFKR